MTARTSATDPLALSKRERFLLSEEWVRSILEDAREPAPPPTPPPDPKPRNKVVYVASWQPRDLALCMWLLNQLSLGTRNGYTDASGRIMWIPRRLLLWTLQLYPRMRRMLWILLSGKAADDVVIARAAVCGSCEYQKVARNGKAYCGSCNCPAWYGSRLAVKNRRRRNHCPQHRHSGEYVRLERYRWPNKQPDASPATQVGGGCGGNRNG